MDALFWLTAAVALGGAAVQGMSGFGFGLVTMSLLPLFLPVEQAVPMVAAWGWTLNLWICWRLRRHISLRNVGPLLGGALLGVPVGVLFLKGADERLVRGTLGVVLVGYCVHAFVRARAAARPARPLPPAVGVVAGVLGGALGGAFNTSGPPAIVYVNAMGWDKHVATATLQAFFVLASSIALAGHATVGLFTPDVVTALLPLFPAVWIGVFLGTRIYDRVPQARFHKLVLGLLFVLGVNFLVRAALG